MNFLIGIHWRASHFFRFLAYQNMKYATVRYCSQNISYIAGRNKKYFLVCGRVRCKKMRRKQSYIFFGLMLLIKETRVKHGREISNTCKLYCIHASKYYFPAKKGRVNFDTKIENLFQTKNIPSIITHTVSFPRRFHVLICFSELL